MTLILITQFAICGYVVWYTRRQNESNRVAKMMGLSVRDYEPASLLPWRL